MVQVSENFSDISRYLDNTKTINNTNILYNLNTLENLDTINNSIVHSLSNVLNNTLNNESSNNINNTLNNELSNNFNNNLNNNLNNTLNNTVSNTLSNELSNNINNTLNNESNNEVTNDEIKVIKKSVKKKSSIQKKSNVKQQTKINVSENIYIEPYNTNILNTELVKTTLKPNGSSFFYAIHYAFATFRLLNDDDKLSFIQEIRTELGNKVSIESWFEIYNGSIAYLKIVDTMKELISNASKTFCSENLIYISSFDPSLFTLLFRLVNYETIEKQILPLWEMECSNLHLCSISNVKQLKEIWFKIFYNKIQYSIETIETNLGNNMHKMNPNKKHKVITKLALLSNDLFDYIVQKAFERFISEIQDYNKWLPLNILSQLYTFNDVKANILILDDTTKHLYEGMKSVYKREDFQNNLPFIVLLHMNEFHFECLGRQTFVNNKRIINRLFYKDDPFIITLLTYFDVNSLSCI